MKLLTLALPILMLASASASADPTPTPIPALPQSFVDMHALFDLFGDATRVREPYPTMYKWAPLPEGFVLAESSLPSATVEESAALEPFALNSVVPPTNTPSLGGVPLIPWTAITDIDVTGRANPLSAALLTIFIKGSYSFKEFGRGTAPKVVSENGQTEVQIGFERQEDSRKAQALLLKVISDLGDPIPTTH